MANESLFLNKIDFLAVHAEQLTAFICAQAADAAGRGIFHAMALGMAAQAHAFVRTDYERASDLFFAAAQYEKFVAEKAVGLPRALLLLNVVDWLIEGSSLDPAYTIILDVLADTTLLPYIRQRYESNKKLCEDSGSLKRLESDQKRDFVLHAVTD